MTARLLSAAVALAALLTLGAAPAPAPAPAPEAAEVASLPPPPSQASAPFIGEYGTPEDMLVVLERDQRLHALRGDAEPVRLMRVSPTAFIGGGLGRIVFHRTKDGRVEAVSVGGVRMARRDFGAEVEARIRAAVRADPEARRAAALAAQPPVETNRPRMFDLVSLASIDPAIRFDIRYAGRDNFMGFPLYERPGAWLQRPAAVALGRAQQSLKAKGYGLLIYDAYRPWFVTKMFWDATPPEHRMFVADPAQGSRHNRGAAVDLTLYDLKTGQPVEMPGRYDEFSKRSYPAFQGGTSRQRWLRDLLRREMEQQGFTVYPEEWWHFDYRDWIRYPIGNATFTELAAGAR